ncbi:murein hydrolase activator EnvC family protein [Pseudooceanicola spongiae]|uniref:Peptidoglycan DD-metalloendopeptidase family protein n=1 Tax=Pseudooceanicola spongiae TaxID=2613965 RepID=A0A7L9WRJ1_9RHOB|nr:peptidase M23 [Pseudooceanicola spongiae]QOL82454.1 peptidoglycan DD-metalloendopeptidase family protein [Pseudooceanicola spongiae]
MRNGRLAPLVAAALMVAATVHPQGAQAQSVAAQARAAADDLDAASRALDNAAQASDRTKALTAAIRAYEKGLSAMRQSLRDAALREASMQREFDSQRDEIAALLAVLQTLSREPAPVLMLHPSGPIGTARSGMLMAKAAPALSEKALALGQRLAEAKDLRTIQQGAADQLAQALSGVQQARTALSQAVADRTDLPRRFTADPMKTQLLIATTDTLRDFAASLPDIADDSAGGSDTPLPDLSAQKGHIPLPVQGSVLRRAGEADAAGITRPGLVLATRPRALVTTPTAATLRYLGPLLDYGNVMILEPQSGILFVLAGLDTVYGKMGEVLPAGAPIGLMGGKDAAAGAIVAQAKDGSGGERSETLYIEVRQGNEPQDPETWFELTKDTQ